MPSAPMQADSSGQPSDEPHGQRLDDLDLASSEDDDDTDDDTDDGTSSDPSFVPSGDAGSDDTDDTVPAGDLDRDDDLTREISTRERAMVAAAAPAGLADAPPSAPAGLADAPPSAPAGLADAPHSAPDVLSLVTSLGSAKLAMSQASMEKLHHAAATLAHVMDRAKATLVAAGHDVDTDELMHAVADAMRRRAAGRAPPKRAWDCWIQYACESGYALEHRAEDSWDVDGAVHDGAVEAYVAMIRRRREEAAAADVAREQFHISGRTQKEIFAELARIKKAAEEQLLTCTKRKRENEKVLSVAKARIVQARAAHRAQVDVVKRELAALEEMDQMQKMCYSEWRAATASVAEATAEVARHKRFFDG